MKPIGQVIAESSIGRGLANIRENGIDAELADLEAELHDLEEPTDLDAPRTRRVDPRTVPARFSHLRAAGSCGAHALEAFQDDSGDTLARRLGSGTHAKLLGKPCVTWDEPAKAWMKARDKAIAAGKRPPPVRIAPRSGDVWRDFQREHRDAVILTRAEAHAADAMVAAIRACGHAARRLDAPGVIMERTIFWTSLGRARRSTPDLWRESDAWGPSFNCEIKTARSVDPFFFWRDVKRFAYHAQMADQAEAIEAATGKRPRHSYIIAVESKRPHVVQVYELPPKLLDAGAQLISAWSSKLQVFEATDSWGGYSPRVEQLEFLETGPVFDEEDDEEDEA
jgi:hypothetical protein